MFFGTDPSLLLLAVRGASLAAVKESRGFRNISGVDGRVPASLAQITHFGCLFILPIKAFDAGGCHPKTKDVSSSPVQSRHSSMGANSIHNYFPKVIHDLSIYLVE